MNAIFWSEEVKHHLLRESQTWVQHELTPSLQYTGRFSQFNSLWCLYRERKREMTSSQDWKNTCLPPMYRQTKGGLYCFLRGDFCTKGEKGVKGIQYWFLSPPVIFKVLFYPFCWLIYIHVHVSKVWNCKISNTYVRFKALWLTWKITLKSVQETVFTLQVCREV